jgi:cytochrome c oxidase assembly protein subunit 15
VRRWLVASAIAVVAAVVLGGITRLTESGLSITVWQPVRGIVPPLSQAEWQDAYQQFLQIPQAQSVHRGISLEAFRTIFWWEWTHRLLARLVGLVLTVPYLLLLWRGAIRPGLRRRLALLPLLALAQGALGWYMVASGLQVRLSVSPYRLAAHLALALVLWVLCIWTILELTPARDTGSVSRGMRRAVTFGAAFTAITLVSGALVAGLDAGLVYNTFPRMGDGVVPAEYGGILTNWRWAFEHPVVVQFHHRVLAIATALFLLGLAVAARGAGGSPSLRRATTVTAILILLQVALGITTLLLHVPLVIAVLHQATGLAVLAAATWGMQRSWSTPHVTGGG